MKLRSAAVTVKPRSGQSALTRPGSHQRPHRRPSAGPRFRLNDDPYVLTERVEKAIEPLHGEARKPPPMQVRDVRLGDAENTRRYCLGQPPRCDQVPNGARQLRLGEQLVGVRPPKICEAVVAGLVSGL